MAAGMNHLMVKAMVVVLPAVEGGRSRDADHVILGWVVRGKSRVVDRAEPGIFHDGSGLFG